jgi:hypothetical protein
MNNNKKRIKKNEKVPVGGMFSDFFAPVCGDTGQVVSTQLFYCHYYCVYRRSHWIYFCISVGFRGSSKLKNLIWL